MVPRRVEILLDDVACAGRQARLIDCPRGQIVVGEHNCSLRHTEDAGVRCVAEGETDGYLIFRLPDDREHHRDADVTVDPGGTLHYSARLSKKPAPRPRPLADVRMDVAVDDSAFVVKPTLAFWWGNDGGGDGGRDGRDWTWAVDLELSVPSAVSPGASAVVVHRIERSGYASGAGHADNDYPGEFRITVTVADPSRVPAAPEGLAATVSNNVDVALSWSAPSDPGGAAVTGYRVESASGTGPWEFLATVDDQTVAFQHADAFESATTIRYRVAAINRYGTGAYATLSVPAGSN